MTTLSIVVPTTGRVTLARTLASITSQAGAGDRVIVAADTAVRGPGPTWQVVKRAARKTTCQWSLVAVKGGDYGYTARTAALRLADTSHVAFMDDDDVYLPGALAAMRQEAGDTPAIFRMEHPNYDPIWDKPVLEFRNVGSPMFVIPNAPDKFGVWAAHTEGHGGDFTFITGCVERMGDPTWHEQAIARVRPELWRRTSPTP